MQRFADAQRISFSLRVLTAVAALATFLSLPLLLQAAPWPLALPVAAAGLFSASVAVPGRGPRLRRHG